MLLLCLSTVSTNLLNCSFIFDRHLCCLLYLCIFSLGLVRYCHSDSLSSSLLESQQSWHHSHEHILILHQPFYSCDLYRKLRAQLEHNHLIWTSSLPLLKLFNYFPSVVWSRDFLTNHRREFKLTLGSLSFK